IRGAQGLNFAISATDAKVAMDVMLARAASATAIVPQLPPVTVPAPRQPFPVGSLVQVDTPSDCLLLRIAPSLTAPRIDCRRDGEQLRVTGNAVAADGQTWLPVATLSGAPSGWASATYLKRAVGAAQPTSPPASPQVQTVRAYYQAANDHRYAEAYAL